MTASVRMAQTPANIDAEFPLLLIIDNDDTVRLPIADFLKGLRWKVVHANDLPSATRLCASRCFDVILLEASMAADDLGNTVQAIRYGNAKNQSATIIAYGTPDQPPLTNKSADHDVDLFVKTPIEHDRLPVYIAQASTRRLEKTYHSRKTSNVHN